MPRFKLSAAFLILLGLVAACQVRPEGQPAATTLAGRPAVAPGTARPARIEATKPLASSVVGTYRLAADSADCDCDLAVTIWRAGPRLRYRIENYPEQGLATVDTTGGSRGLGFVSIPALHEEAHEWGGRLEGDTLLVQTYGNAMNEYENFVGGCGCKFLMLVKQP